MGTGAERESDSSHTSTVEVKNAWSFNYIPTHVFVAQCSKTGLHLDIYFLHIFKQTPQPSVSADPHIAASFSTTSRQTLSISHYAIRTDRKSLQAYASYATSTYNRASYKNYRFCVLLKSKGPYNYIL